MVLKLWLNLFGNGYLNECSAQRGSHQQMDDVEEIKNRFEGFGCRWWGKEGAYNQPRSKKASVGPTPPS